MNPPLAPPQLAAGGLVGGRFRILARFASGGMGTVYRAFCTATEQPVALKILNQGPGAQAVSRLVREAEILAQLRAPGIVRYVADGFTEAGVFFLAMEWLDGHDLAHHLAQQRLDVASCLLLARQIASALAVAHQAGIIHRDLKPSNIFLRDGRVDRVVLLDFGVARHAARVRGFTETGALIGTPDYMAPEQARGQVDLTPAADVFSLGCVLFECLTGQPPFASEQLAAVLARILFAPPPPLRSRCPAASPELEALVNAMLAKEPAERPADAALALAALALIPESAQSDPAEESVPPPLAVSAREQRLASVLLASLPSAPRDADVPGTAGETPATTDRGEAVRAALAAAGARCELLTDGSLVATLLSEDAAATDQAVQLAGCALLLRGQWGFSRIVITTGRCASETLIPVGDALDRAAQILGTFGVPERLPRIVMDEVTARLLDERFRIERAGQGIYHLIERIEDKERDAREIRPLLGRETPCVGRDVELNNLENSLHACIADSVVRAALLLAPPGGGKSRLRQEFLRRAQARHPEVLLLFGRGEPLRTSAAYHLLAQALRSLLGVSQSAPQGLPHRQLAEGLAARAPGALSDDGADFIAELCGLPPSGRPNTRMAAARTDPRLMADQIQQAFVDLLQALCAQSPVLLVLEDLHLGDSRTVKLVDAALSALGEAPLMVLALARPEITQQFPGLWAGKVTEIPLRPLSRRAGERLVNEVLSLHAPSGAKPPPEVVSRIVEQAAGNPLYLEELIRAAAEGSQDEAPATVVAMLQARLGRVDARVRRVLLLSSVYGLSFWPSAVQRLLGEDTDPSVIERSLRGAVEAELLDCVLGSRSAVEREYRFRHALLREAAYGLLPTEDKRIAHQLALRYLTDNGETDTAVLAEHAWCAEKTEQALELFVTAARGALLRSNLSEVLRLCERARECGARGTRLGEARSMELLSFVWSRQWELAIPIGEEALSLLTPGSLPWCQVVGPFCLVRIMTAQQEAGVALAEQIVRVDPEPGALPSYVESVALLLGAFSLRCLRAVSAQLLQRLRCLTDVIAEDQLLVRGWAALSYCEYLRHTDPDPWLLLRLGQHGTDLLQRAGDLRMQIFALDFLGQVLGEIGDAEGGQRILRESLALAQRIKEPYSIVHAKLHLAALLAEQPDATLRSEAEQLARELLGSPSTGASFLGWAHGILARALLGRGEAALAEEEAQRSLSASDVVPLRQMLSQHILIRALLQQGRIHEACIVARSGLDRLAALGGGGYAECRLRLAAAEALYAAAEHELAREVLRTTIHLVHDRAAQIQDAAWKSRYLNDVPAHAQLIELARSWGMP